MKQQSFHHALSHLTETGFRVFLFTSLIFAVVTGLYNVWLSLGEVTVVLIIYLIWQARTSRRTDDVLQYLDEMNTDVNYASRRTMISSPLPIVIFHPHTGDIVWSNDRFLHLTGNREHLFETNITTLTPGFRTDWLLNGESIDPELVEIGERQYLVYGNLVSTSANPEDQLATTYWVEVTGFAQTAAAYERTRPILMILQIDSYEDLIKGLDEGERAVLWMQVNNLLTDWIDEAEGTLCRYDRDHYLILLESAPLLELLRNKFSIMSEIRKIQSPNGMAVTLSVGIGRGGESPKQLYDFASLALDMALGRGGDQVVIKDGLDYTFIGGRSKETERRTKVKSRVMATAMAEQLAAARCVLVMGHKVPDVDVVGACAGVVAMARKLEVPARIVKAPSPNPADDLVKRLSALPEYKNLFITPEEARHLATSDAVLVVVDTNRPEQTQAPELLTTQAKVIVIDHHRRASSYIQSPTLSFQDPYASSASELMTELVQYTLDAGDLRRGEAEAMLAGIILDTKSFTLRTGSRTFEAAAYLRQAGADTTEVNRLFQNDLEHTVSKLEIVQSAQVHRDVIAVAFTEKKVGRVIASQAADQLLNILGIEASLVLFQEEGQACLSARSRGSINVQVLTEMLGGGGNAAAAGAQFPGKTSQEVLPELTAAIDRYFEEGEEGS